MRRTTIATTEHFPAFDSFIFSWGFGVAHPPFLLHEIYNLYPTTCTYHEVILATRPEIASTGMQVRVANSELAANGRQVKDARSSIVT